MSTAPVLDLDALRLMGEELGDPSILCGFLRRYVTLLDGRVDRLERALVVRDREGWFDAALSLKASSAMAGAQALAERIADLQEDLAPERGSAPCRPGLACPAVAVACLRELATETARQVQGFLQTTGATAIRPGR
jgi:HPt (histidine-containing phosphotransfer) domain-containing protein